MNAEIEPLHQGLSAARMKHRGKLPFIGKQVSIRLDYGALRALRELEATGLSRSDAIRKALVEAASRLRGRAVVEAEVATLQADDEDQAEMLAVADLMKHLRAPG